MLLLLCILGASAQPMLPAGEADPSRMQSPALTGIVPAAARTTDATAPGLAPRPGMAALASGLMGLGPGAGPIDPTETLHRTQELLSENAAAREVPLPQDARTPVRSHAPHRALAVRAQALSAAAAEVAAHPGQQRALATLMGLMNQPAGARTVIDSVRYRRCPMSRRRRALSRAAAPQCRDPRAVTDAAPLAGHRAPARRAARPRPHLTRFGPRPAPRRPRRVQRARASAAARARGRLGFGGRGARAGGTRARARGDRLTRTDVAR